MSGKRTIKLVSSLSKVVSKLEVNAACPWLTYQPQLPEKVKKLKVTKNM